MRTRGAQTKKTMGERAREGEREGKSAPSPLTPFPNVFRSDLGSAFAAASLTLRTAKKPPATQAAPVALNHYLVT